MDFLDCVVEAQKNPELVKNFNRLTGRNFRVDNRKPIERMIDEATGFQAQVDKKKDEDTLAFMAFCWECVWKPLKSQESKEAKQ